MPLTGAVHECRPRRREEHNRSGERGDPDAIRPLYSQPAISAEQRERVRGRPSG